MVGLVAPPTAITVSIVALDVVGGGAVDLTPGWPQIGVRTRAWGQLRVRGVGDVRGIVPALRACLQRVTIRPP